MVQLSCFHVIGRSCYRENNFRCVKNCRYSKCINNQTQLMLGDLLIKKLKDTDSLKCLAHPKHKVKFYWENIGSFYCYKCFAQRQLLDQTLIPLSQLQPRFKQHIIKSAQRTQDEFHQLESKLWRNDQIQDYLIEQKQIAESQAESLIALIKASLTRQHQALDSTAKNATDNFNRKCINYISQKQIAAEELRQQALLINEESENMIILNSQYFDESKELAENFKLLSIEVPEWDQIEPKTDQWKEQLNKYNKLFVSYYEISIQGSIE
ncbi:hypothetical protein FGO68_gene13518 [Halteria grandinella]|uniref:Uncharacterized protein n=1 Tax=Halteria grandinella TaxID=5974 RepID=A0A8J8NTV0_HALGN|nr:hypothetical protein FGO68_gene13518 [Halteria grandinella]